MTTRVALVGATGHGASHLRTIAELEAAGRVRLVGLCDVREVPSTVPLFRDFHELLDTLAPDVVVVCTPPHTHLPIALAAVRAGADVLLEKPPVLDLAEHDILCEALARTDRVCQVGFQALGSAALLALQAAIGEGRLGRLTGIGVAGAWLRDETYFRRSPWVGRATVDGRRSLDGALANPFAHALMQVLAIAGAPPATVEVERYRTRAIEVDDTASLRLTFQSGLTAVIAVTLCAEEFRAGDITVTGTGGTAVLEYPTDRLRLPGQSDLMEVSGRVGLLANLLDHRHDRTVRLLVPLERTRTFTALLEPIVSVEPVDIDPAMIETRSDLAAPRFAVRGVNAAIDAAAARLALFSELPFVAWAHDHPQRS